MSLGDDAHGDAVRTEHAKNLNFFTARIVRAMLAKGDLQALRDTGCGTPDQALTMLRCYELATLMGWDVEALADASDYDGYGLRFGESRAAVMRRIKLAMKGSEATEILRPVDGVALLYRLGIRVVEELEETVSHLDAIGFYEPEAEDHEGTPPLESSERDVARPRPQHIWDESALRTLLVKYQLPGASHASLAKEYGVTRQLIARQLKKAKDQFGPKKASWVSPVARSNPKN